jgi:hypothetical protein
MRDELGTDKIDPLTDSARRGAAIFRQWLFDMADSKNQYGPSQGDFIELQKLRASGVFDSPNGEGIKRAIWCGFFVDSYPNFAAHPRKLFNLKPLIPPEGNDYQNRGADLLRRLEAALRLDRPVLATILYSDADQGKGVWKDPRGDRHYELKLELDKTKNFYGHWIVITGLRYDEEGLADKKQGERVWVHLTADFLVDDDEGRFYVPLDKLLEVLPWKERELKEYVIPETWQPKDKDWDVIPSVEPIRMSSLFFLSGKAVDVRKELPARPPKKYLEGSD